MTRLAPLLILTACASPAPAEHDADIEIAWWVTMAVFAEHVGALSTACDDMWQGKMAIQMAPNVATTTACELGPDADACTWQRPQRSGVVHYEVMLPEGYGAEYTCWLAFHEFAHALEGCHYGVMSKHTRPVIWGPGGVVEAAREHGMALCMGE